MAGTRTLRSTGPSPAWEPSSAPGCSAEFGDDPHRYADGKARTQLRRPPARSPARPGKKKVVAARFIRNDRLVDALMAQAFTALNASPGARALYDELRARGIEHNDALRGSPTGSSASCTDA